MNAQTNAALRAAVQATAFGPAKAGVLRGAVNTRPWPLQRLSAQAVRAMVFGLGGRTLALAGVVSLGAHLTALAAFAPGPEPVLIAGGSGAGPAALGNSFADFAIGGIPVQPGILDPNATEYHYASPDGSPDLTEALEPVQPSLPDPVAPESTEAVAEALPVPPAEALPADPAAAPETAGPVPPEPLAPAARTPAPEAVRPAEAAPLAAAEAPAAPVQLSALAAAVPVASPVMAGLAQVVAAEPPAEAAAEPLAPLAQIAAVPAAETPDPAAEPPVEALAAVPAPPALLEPVPEAEVEVQTATAATPRPQRRPPPQPVAQPRPQQPQPVPQGQARTRAPAPPGAAPVQAGNADVNARRGTADGTAAGTGIGGGQGDGSAAGNAAVTNYPGQVFRRIQRTRQARVPGRGAAVVAFSVGAGGELAGARVQRSSGNPAIDQAAVDHIRRSAPFPAPPPGAGRNFSYEFVVR